MGQVTHKPAGSDYSRWAEEVCLLGLAWLRGHVFIGAWKQVTGPSPNHGGYHMVSLILQSSTPSFTRLLLEASAMSAPLFPY